MSGLHFGSSLGPSTIKYEESPRNVEQESGEVAGGDPNQLVQCPFDKNHQIRANRFPFHIIKCRKNNPKIARELRSCPFNARHLIHKHEFSHHIEMCVDKRTVSPEEEAQHKFNIPLTPWKAPDPEEDWDKEADDQATPFVWGVSTNQLVEAKPDPSTTNSLPPGLRAPRTLPWKPRKKKHE